MTVSWCKILEEEKEKKAFYVGSSDQENLSDCKMGRFAD